MPEPRIWIDTTIPDHPLLARSDRSRDDRPNIWRIGFAHGYVSDWHDNYNGNLTYGAGYNAGSDLAQFHSGAGMVVDLEEVL